MVVCIVFPFTEQRTIPTICINTRDFVVKLADPRSSRPLERTTMFSSATRKTEKETSTYFSPEWIPPLTMEKENNNFAISDWCFSTEPLCGCSAFNSKVKANLSLSGRRRRGVPIEGRIVVMHTAQILMKFFRRCPWFQHLFMPCFSKGVQKEFFFFLKKSGDEGGNNLVHIPNTRSTSQTLVVY